MQYVIAVAVLSATLGQAADPQKPVPIVGTWETIDRHVAMGSLFQPVHGVRKRECVVRFEQEGVRLRGWALNVDHEAITHQQRWKDGRTEFRKVSFEGGRLTFEWDIAEWFPTAGPIAVEQKRLENKGTIRVEATLVGERLVGTWKMFLADETEVFRGEWEGVRALGAPAESGPVLLIGGRHQDLTSDIRKAFVELAGGKEAKIVVIPTAIATADEQATQDELRQPWLDLGPKSVEVLHTRDPKTASDPVFIKPLTEATAVFFTNGHQHRVFDAYRGTLVEKELLKLQARGGLVAGTGSGAVILGEQVMSRPRQDVLTEPGLRVLFGLVVEDERDSDRIAAAIAANPRYVGLLVEPATAAVIRGKKISVIGEGKVTVRAAQGAGQEAKIEILKSGGELDLAGLRRETAAGAMK